jgi:hypothetical protein
MYNTKQEYFDAITQETYQKPVVHYKPTELPILVGNRAIVITVDHPASYLNDAPYVYTSMVVEYDAESGVFETLNTKYVPFKEEVK